MSHHNLLHKSFLDPVTDISSGFDLPVAWETSAGTPQQVLCHTKFALSLEAAERIYDRVHGLTSVSLVDRYQLCLTKSPMFTWRDVMDQFLPQLLQYKRSMRQLGVTLVVRAEEDDDE